MSQSLFYWIIYSYSLQSNPLKDYQDVSILILLDYLFLLYLALCDKLSSVLSQSLFYWIIYSYSLMRSYVVIDVSCLNPYFTGLSILIITAYIIRYDSLSLNPYFTGLSILIVPMDAPNVNMGQPSQSLFYWIIYSYDSLIVEIFNFVNGSQSLFYWIIYSYLIKNNSILDIKRNVSILILLDYLFLSVLSRKPSIYCCYRVFFRH